ncbi:transketolase [Helicobacter bizzozeronii]|uniref:transketolase n=1 Tax=Helicobacter bizzozeronii TaxID=56877 RepID=UPI000CEDED6B|nr:transketolase [Helicobacter bizzozeronii]
MKNNLESKILSSKKRLLKTAYDCQKSVHLGGSLSIIDLLGVLYTKHLKYRLGEPSWELRDRFILSKGHCAAALYSVLVECGIAPQKEMDHFMRDDCSFCVHPIMDISLGIEASTGSLGQGVGLAVGIAKAAKIKQKDFHVYTLIGDGESNEGSVWEVAMFAAHNKLDNLTIILDKNNHKSDGLSSSVLDMGNIAQKWESFGFYVEQVNGHDVDQIDRAFSKKNPLDMPKIIVSESVKGHGISFMENKPEWHHNRLTKQFYEKALEELGCGS